MPLANVRPRWVDQFSLAMLLSFFEVAFVSTSVRPYALTIARDFTIFKLSLVAPAICEIKNSLPIFDTIDPVPFVGEVGIRVLVLPLPMTQLGLCADVAHVTVLFSAMPLLRVRHFSLRLALLAHLRCDF